MTEIELQSGDCVVISLNGIHKCVSHIPSVIKVGDSLPNFNDQKKYTVKEIINQGEGNIELIVSESKLFK